MREREVLQRFITSIDVYDSEWDVVTYTDVQFGEGPPGILIITDMDDFVLAMYAPGAWLKVEVSRVNRLESTDSDGETNDTSATERDARVPRDGDGAAGS